MKDTADFVARSRAAQGLLPTVTDPATLRYVARIVLGLPVQPVPPSAADIERWDAVEARRRARAEARRAAEAERTRAENAYVLGKWRENFAQLTSAQVVEAMHKAFGTVKSSG